MKKILMVLLVLIVAMSVFAGGQKEPVKEEVVFYIINGAEPPSLDPSLSEDTTSHNIL
ncbi:MAG TPA: peptide ABC transporter substrate-binding protein, partial [Spirochaetales bacterium]|nr:peptide ABC transporter substrate-binding protein [Spirochaetales bacterium]